MLEGINSCGSRGKGQATHMWLTPRSGSFDEATKMMRLSDLSQRNHIIVHAAFLSAQ